MGARISPLFCRLKRRFHVRVALRCVARREIVLADIDVKKHFNVVFFKFLSRFFIFQTLFLFLRNVGKVQSGKQVNKKHFQNNSNEIDL